MAESFASRLPPASSDTMLGPETLSLRTTSVVPAAPINLDTLRPIDPNARATLGGFAEPTTEDAGGAKLIDLTARAKLGGFKNPEDEFDAAPAEADPNNEFDAVDDLDARTVADLDKDRENFDPVSYLSGNPDVANDPARLKKLLDIRRLRDEEGLTAKRVIKAAKKGGPELAKAVVPAVREVTENVVDVTVQPVVNYVLGALTGDLQNAQTRKALFAGPKKSLGELSAAAESQATGMMDLARQGVRKEDARSPVTREESVFLQGLATKAGRRDPKLPIAEPVKKTDQQLLAELSDDVEFRRNAADIIGGSGEGAKLVNLDAETLAKEGITLDPKAIEAISLVEPLTLVAGAGVFKVVGAAGKVIATANTLAGAEKFVAGMAKFTASKLAKGGGRVATDVGKGLSSRTFGTLGMASPLITGDISGLTTAVGAKYVVAPLAKKTGAALTQVGKEIAGELPASPGMQRLMNIAGGATDAGISVGAGAAKGALASAPFAVMTDDDETAGAFLGAGAALGAGASGLAGGAKAAVKAGGKAFRAVKTNAARELFGPNRKPMQDVPSADYGRNVPLDEMHRAEATKLTPQNLADVNNFREALRSQGGEIYAVNKETFRSKAADKYKTETGKEIPPELLDTYERHSAFFDETVAGKKIVYLNSDTTGLLHDSGHIFDALLSPEKQAELNTAIDNAFTPEAIAEFQKNYQDLVGNKISAADAKKEYRAELFGALFNNVPVTDLAAPKGLLKTFAGIAAEGAEALGIDLTGGIRTPSVLRAPQTVGLRNMFESAARSVLEKGKELAPKSPAQPVPPVIADYVAPPPPPRAPEPALPPEPAPTPPRAPEPAINIRGIEAKTLAPLTEPLVATPAVRAAAAERAKITGITEARELAKKNPASAKAVEDISTSMEAGNPVVTIIHRGITSPGGPGAPEGAVGRKATRATGYEKLEAAQIEFRENAPADIVSLHEKTFKPLRWDTENKKPTLIAVSIDKIAANAIRIAKDERTAGTHPYEVVNKKFTDAGWKEVLADAQTHAENQANGRKGDGSRLELPAEELGLSIPAENPSYTPKFLSPERANFQNALQGVETPRTAREKKGQIAGNLKGQLVSEANKRKPEIPANIPLKSADKQSFISVPGRVVREVNPFRNELERRGFNTRNLDSAIERIRAQDIVSTTPKPEIKFAGMVTDISRAGFLPAPTEFRQKNLAGKTVPEFLEGILTATPDEWKAATENMTGGLTGGAWNLALGLTDIADLGALKMYQEKLSVATKDAMAAGDFDKAYSMVSRAQFMRESIEAATGTGSAGAAFKSGKMGFDESNVKVPFPVEQPKKE